MVLHYSLTTYNTFILPVLTYVAQLCPVTPEVIAVEAKALRDLLPGPFAWVLPQDLHYLADLYGQHVSAPSIRDVCSAAQLRILTYENQGQGGLKVRECAEELHALRMNTDFSGRLWSLQT